METAAEAIEHDQLPEIATSTQNDLEVPIQDGYQGASGGILSGGFRGVMRGRSAPIKYRAILPIVGYDSR